MVGRLFGRASIKKRDKTPHPPSLVFLQRFQYSSCLYKKKTRGFSGKAQGGRFFSVFWARARLAKIKTTPPGALRKFLGYNLVFIYDFSNNWWKPISWIGFFFSVRFEVSLKKKKNTTWGFYRETPEAHSRKFYINMIRHEKNTRTRESSFSNAIVLSSL